MKPTIIKYNGIKVVKIKDIKGFDKWLIGQTIPILEEMKDKYGWAYYEDYKRFIKGLPNRD